MDIQPARHLTVAYSRKLGDFREYAIRAVREKGEIPSRVPMVTKGSSYIKSVQVGVSKESCDTSYPESYLILEDGPGTESTGTGTT